MSKLDFLDFHAKFIAFGNQVRANRAECDTRFAEVVHDRLADALEQLAGFCREGHRAEALLRTETDPAAREALEMTIDFCVGDLETEIGDFRVKDAILDQFDEGLYEGQFCIQQIFPFEHTV